MVKLTIEYPVRDPVGSNFFPAMKICHSPTILRLCEYEVSDMERSGVSTGVRKPGKHGRCTDRHDMTEAVKKRRKPHHSSQHYSIFLIRIVLK